MVNRLSALMMLLLGLSSAAAQDELSLEAGDLYAQVLESLQADTAAVPFALVTETTQPIFFPEDVQRQFGQGIYYLHFSRLKGRIIAVPDGTGRVYEFQSVDQKLKTERLDQSTFTGYNFSAFAFTFRDTLYSLGGYGFWKYNGILRHYDPVTKGWDVTPTNMEFPISGDPGYIGQWISPASDGLYYIARSLPQPGLKNHPHTFGLIQDSTRLYRLDLNHRNWKLLGRISPGARPHLNNAGKVAELPFGELIITGEAGERKIMLLDYDGNRLMMLRDSLARPLARRVFTGAANKFTWYSAGALHLGPSLPDTVYRLPLDSDSFTSLGIPIYETSVAESTRNLSDWKSPLWLVVGALAGLIIGRSAFGKKTTPPKPAGDSLPDAQEVFHSFEISILRGFLKHNLSLLPEEMNVLLETDSKSVEVQKKYRSEAIRGINKKCGNLLATDQRLILQERLADDRRQFIYRLNPELVELLGKRVTGLAV